MTDAPGTIHIRSSNLGAPNAAFWWELVSDTGQLMARSTNLPTRETAEKALDWVKKHIGECPVEVPRRLGGSQPIA